MLLLQKNNRNIFTHIEQYGFCKNLYNFDNEMVPMNVFYVLTNNWVWTHAIKLLIKGSFKQSRTVKKCVNSFVIDMCTWQRRWGRKGGGQRIWNKALCCRMQFVRGPAKNEDCERSCKKCSFVRAPAKICSLWEVNYFDNPKILWKRLKLSNDSCRQLLSLPTWN